MIFLILIKSFIEYYSYYQVHTFIKLSISKFNIFDAKLKFTNSQDDDITKKSIKLFPESTKYFTNRGFPKKITDKKLQIKEKIDLCSDAYEYDLNKINYKTPLIFIDKDKKKCKFEINSRYK